MATSRPSPPFYGHRQPQSHPHEGGSSSRIPRVRRHPASRDTRAKVFDCENEGCVGNAVISFASVQSGAALPASVSLVAKPAFETPRGFGRRSSAARRWRECCDALRLHLGLDCSTRPARPVAPLPDPFRASRPPESDGRRRRQAPAFAT